jgi:hypothetical protein
MSKHSVYNKMIEWLMNNEYERTWKEAYIAEFMYYLTWRGQKKSQKKPQSGQPISGLKLEPRT